MTETKTKTKQYLTFYLNEEEYAIDVYQIREILELTNITKIPCTYDYMRGVINLRGSVVPVIDMHMKFGLQNSKETVNSCIIVMEVKIEDKFVVLGVLADSVEEVIDLEPENIEPAPKIGTKVKSEFIKGMGRHDDRFLILLDMNRVFSENELVQMEDATDLMEKTEIIE
jgi:purine-binding chemotaxis protein CheW